MTMVASIIDADADADQLAGAGGVGTGPAHRRACGRWHRQHDRLQRVDGVGSQAVDRPGHSEIGGDRAERLALDGKW